MAARKHLVWGDLRCDILKAKGCEETFAGDWVANASDIAALVKAAKQSGWNTSNGNTICPACSKLEDH